MFKFNSHLPKLFLKADKVKYGKGLRLIGWPFIFRFPKASVYIGDDVTINSNFFSNLLGLYVALLFHLLFLVLFLLYYFLFLLLLFLVL